jgi:flagellar basal body-associated protein FliL
MIVWGGGAFATMWLPGGPMAVATAVASDGFPLAVAELGEAGEPIVAQATGETLTLADGGDQGAAGAASAGTLNIPLEPFVVGVSDGPGRAFLMARIGLEVGDQAAADELAKSLQKVRDRIVIVLSSQDKGSLMAQDGKERLRGLILREANTSMGTHKINKVVFHQLIIQ